VTLFSGAERNRFGGNRFAANWSDVVLSGRDSATEWSIDGRGNSWSRYRGFDFDGDGRGDAPHPVVGAFERLEGANPGVRLFLQSPAAAGLELAARMSRTAQHDGLDSQPIVDHDRRGAPAVTTRVVWVVGVVVLLAIVRTRVQPLLRRSSETGPCSR